MTPTTETTETFSGDILAAIGYSKSSPVVLRERQSERLADILNQMIEAGAWFDVAENEFQIINAERLRQSAIDFLKVNRRAALCVLQQSLLAKHLFSHAEHSLEDFAFEVEERESILTETGRVSFDAHFEAVREVTRKWFGDLLRNK